VGPQGGSELGNDWDGGCWGGREAEAIGMEAVGVVTIGGF